MEDKKKRKLKRFSINEDIREEQDEEFIDYYNEINEMLLDPDYEFADDTLSGIKRFMDKNGEITDNMKSAIDNIKNSLDYSDYFLD